MYREKFCMDFNVKGQIVLRLGEKRFFFPSFVFPFLDFNVILNYELISWKIFKLDVHILGVNQ